MGSPLGGSQKSLPHGHFELRSLSLLEGPAGVMHSPLGGRNREPGGLFQVWALPFLSLFLGPLGSHWVHSTDTSASQGLSGISHSHSFILTLNGGPLSGCLNLHSSSG